MKNRLWKPKQPLEIRSYHPYKQTSVNQRINDNGALSDAGQEPAVIYAVYEQC